MLTLSLLYGVIVTVLSIGAFFILYHILRYSLSKTYSIFGSVLFLAVFLLLLTLNFWSFQTIETSTPLPTAEMLPLLELENGPALSPKATNPW